ncbi:MAG: DMT family transporter [Hyphomicrobiales bacterium]|nr:DMT family transporter [Hyphomicrobiales bacterium]
MGLESEPLNPEPALHEANSAGAKPLSAWLMLLATGGIWGITFSLAKLVTEAGAHPLGISWWQAVIGGGLTLAYSVLRKAVPPLTRQHAIFYLVCGALGTAIPGTLFFYAAPHIPAGVISITIAIVPMATLALAVPLGLDRWEISRIAGIILGVVAVGMIVAPDTSLPEAGMTFWVLVCVAASGCYALENLWLSLRRPVGSDAFAILTGMLLMATLMLTPVVFAADAFVPLFKTWGVVELSIVAMAVVNTTCYGIFIHLVTTAGPVFASQAAYLVTLSGIFWGIVIFQEQHSWWIWGALLVMMAGLALVKPRH